MSDFQLFLIVCLIGFFGMPILLLLVDIRNYLKQLSSRSELDMRKPE